jgi:CRP/FNR family cyclic AMP-dependent transcriptional regulator
MESLERILSDHPFFSDLDRRYLPLIVGCASNVRFREGEYLFHAGGEADKFYLIREGKVALEVLPPNRPPITIQTVSEGEVVGWSWLIPPHKWKFDARAAEPVRAFTLDGKCLRAKCEEDHDLGYAFLKRFAHLTAQRLQATRLQLLEIYEAWHLLTDGRS